MKNRRIVVVALMLVAVLCVGVGYAALQDEITFTGNINYTTDFQLTFTDAISGTNASLVTSPTVNNETGALTVSIDASSLNLTENDSMTFTAVVSNPSKYKADNITIAATDSACFDIEATTASSIEAGETAEVMITITMTAYPVPTNGSVATDVVTFTVTGTQAAN